MPLGLCGVPIHRSPLGQNHREKDQYMQHKLGDHCISLLDLIGSHRVITHLVGQVDSGSVRILFLRLQFQGVGCRKSDIQSVDRTHRLHRK